MKISSIVITHLLAWVMQFLVLFVVFSIIIGSSGSGWIISDSIIWQIALILLPGLMIPFYAFYFLWNGITRGENKLIWYIIALLILLLLPLVYLKLDEQVIDLSGYLKCAVLVAFFALLGFLFRSFFYSIAQSREKDILQKQHLETELNFLKGQISPHFLFNTLNNIDSLIATDPETASKSLISLSDAMRYMIYKTNESNVLLSAELEYLENVIALYKLRYKKERTISYRQQGEAQAYKIPPMLLIPIVENAFKHYSQKFSKEGIKISVLIGDGKLELSCSNAYDHTAGKTQSSGIGLQTLKRRLELLCPGEYKLEIQSSSSIFRIKLTIPLSQ